jgi:hypothetical protein
MSTWLKIAAMSTTIQMNFYKKENKFVVGIDLGTTNCAVAYFDTEKGKQAMQIFPIPQQGKHGHEESHPLLPSFLYVDEEGQRVVGMWAKIEGFKVPTRLIQSAKSWLSNPAAERKEKILPFDSAHPDHRLSPVEASSYYLDHIRKMWNRQMAHLDPAKELEEQEIILTIPASFDEVARTLTVEAALKVGLKRLTLLEEPQASFYNWLMEHGAGGFKAGDSVLICDVGGGTTDFTLIDVVEGEGGIEMRRMAVGNHLLLGGDNMDAALCHALENRLGQELDLVQHLSLLQQAREAKEALFSKKGPSSHSIFLAGKGGQVLKGSVSLELSYEEAADILLEGFFGIYPFEEAIQLKKGSGIRQMGLAYETEPSITKHLASFFYKNGRSTMPTYLLFNGGAMKPQIFQKQIVTSLQKWFGEAREVEVLSASTLDLAVAKGAAYFGKVRQSKEVYIGGGIPRSYYLEIVVENQKKALTLVPRGINEGSRLRSQQRFLLAANQPVSFQLYHSHTRLHDKVGDLLPIEEEQLAPLPLMQTLCTYGKKGQKEAIAVHLEIYLTAVGTLELWLLSETSEHKWKLEFQLSEKSTQCFSDETYEARHLEAAQKEVTEAFSVGAQGKLDGLMATLERLLEKERRQWPTGLLRSLYETLQSQAEKRLLSSHYGSRFWNLAGFFLRPGIGYPADDYRIKQMWKLILVDLKKPKSEEIELQQWICLRRIAAGLNRGQQGYIFNELLRLKQKKRGYAYAEHLRALASLELIDIPSKLKLGALLLKKIAAGEGEACDYWALGRLGARQLFYGTAANVIPPTACEEWIQTLLAAPAAQKKELPFTLAMLARKTNCRAIDLNQALLDKIAPLLAEQQDLLFQERDLTPSEQERFFGDSLPTGLTLY